MGLVHVEVIAHGTSPETYVQIIDGITWVYYDGQKIVPLGQKKALPKQYTHPEPGYSFGRCRMIMQDGGRCRQPVSQGHTFCNAHSATLENPHNLKHGRYSKYLPTRLLKQYEESLQDPGMLNLGNEIALMDSKIAEELEELQVGSPMEAMGHISQAYNLLTLSENDDEVDLTVIRNLLGEAMHIAASGESAWRAILTLVEERRRLVDTERRRMADTGQYLSVAEANALVAYLVNTVIENIKDKTVLDAITARLRIFATGEAQ